MSFRTRIGDLFRAGPMQSRGPRPLLEIHIPISPNPHFFTMLHYFAASLSVNGGAVADSRIVVTVGEDCDPHDLYSQAPWARHYDLEWRWLDRQLFRRDSYYATANERFRYTYTAQAVMLADADTFVTAELASLVTDCLRERYFAGVIAHIPPFGAKAHGSPSDTWKKLYAHVGLPEPEFLYEHTGFGVVRTDPGSRYCPPYFNLGMLMAPAEIMNRAGEKLYADMQAVDEIYPTNFKCQIALTLSLARMGAKTVALPMRFNFANDDRLAQKYPEELKNVRLFHYLRRQFGPFDKTRDFAGYHTIDAFIDREDLDGVNLVMQRALKDVQARVKADLAATGPES